MTTEIRDRRVLPALVAFVVAAFLVIPMVMNAATVNAQSPESEDPCDTASRSTFEDRNEADEVHRASIDCVDYYNISSGDSSGRFFRPNQLVSREQMATFIINTLEAAGMGDRLPSGDAPDEFSDISDSVHRENINILARIDVVRGNNGQYNPQALVRRDQMATYLLQAKEWAYQADYVMTQDHFSDVGPTNVHYDNINAAYDEGLVRGTSEPDGTPNSGTYAPGRNVRRQNMASFLSNELHQVWDAPEQFCAASSPSPSSSASASPSPSASPTSGGGGGLPGLPIGDEESPSPSPSSTASPSSTTSPSATATATTNPSPSSSPCATREASPSPSPSSTVSPRPSASPSASASPSEPEPCIDPTGLTCPDPESPSPSPSASASPTSGSGVLVPLDL